MEIKGVAVKSVSEFVTFNHAEMFQEWLEKLPAQSQEIFSQSIFTSGWYPIQDAVIEPTKITAEMFFGGDLRQACLDGGKFAADAAIRGVYKTFVKIGSPGFLISMASQAFSRYYKEARLEIVEKKAGRAVCRLINFVPPSEIMELRTIGWITRAMEICGCKDFRLNVDKSMAKGEDFCEFSATWS